MKLLDQIYSIKMTTYHSMQTRKNLNKAIQRNFNNRNMSSPWKTPFKCLKMYYLKNLKTSMIQMRTKSKFLNTIIYN